MFTPLLCLGIVLLSSSYEVEGFSKCQEAQLCVHNGLERCGQDIKTKKFRRFLDWCDLKEYNCLFSADFLHTTNDQCAHLPTLDKELTSKTPFKNPTIRPSDNNPERRLFVPHGEILRADDPRVMGKNREIGFKSRRRLEGNNRRFLNANRFGGDNQGVKRAIGKVKSKDKSTVPNYKKVTRRVWLR